jgi:protein TonB
MPLRPAVAPRSDGKLDRRSFAASMFLHLAVFAALLAPLWPRQPDPTALPPITLVLEDGSSGASGGTAGGGGGSAEAEQTATRMAQTAEPQQAEAAETPTEPVVEAPTPLPTPNPVPVKKSPPKVKPKPKPPVAASAPTPEPPSSRVQQAWTAPQRMPGPAGPVAGPGSAASGSAGEGAGGPGGAGRGLAGTGRGALGEGAEGLGDEYLERLRRWLAKHKTHPRDPKPGTVLVDFTIARDGRVLSASIERSSGVPELDALALKMFRDASPVPPLPANFPLQQARLVLPVNYKVGLFVRLFSD